MPAWSTGYSRDYEGLAHRSGGHTCSYMRRYVVLLILNRGELSLFTVLPRACLLGSCIAPVR